MQKTLPLSIKCYDCLVDIVVRNVDYSAVGLRKGIGYLLEKLEFYIKIEKIAELYRIPSLISKADIEFAVEIYGSDKARMSVFVEHFAKLVEYALHILITIGELFAEDTARHLARLNEYAARKLYILNMQGLCYNLTVFIEDIVISAGFDVVFANALPKIDADC